MAVMIAAAMQPLLIVAMPLTVAPAVPWPAFALVAIFAGVAAWQAEALAAAWPSITRRPLASPLAESFLPTPPSRECTPTAWTRQPACSTSARAPDSE